MITWIKRLLFGRKPRVFLGVAAVLPRTDVKRHFEEIVAGSVIELDTNLQSALKHLFSMPLLTARDDPLDDDRVLDVIVTHHQAGGAEVVQLDEYAIPLAWRPKVTVTARLSDVETNAPINTYVVTEKQPWLPFIQTKARLPDFEQLLWGTIFDNKIVIRLLYRACIKVLTLVKKDLK
ncbi:MAG: hypothetical protein HKN11_02640 [Rhizobiales bacterium]|nr:hypothetical protein [Hyphomicrobiales bacterium]